MKPILTPTRNLKTYGLRTEMESIYSNKENDELANRFKYHIPKNEDVSKRLDLVRSNCYQLAKWIKDNTPPGREQALAFTHLEEVMFWANAGIARSR